MTMMTRMMPVHWDDDPNFADDEPEKKVVRLALVVALFSRHVFESRCAIPSRLVPTWTMMEVAVCRELTFIFAVGG
jgi:hypothetical protein